MNTPARALFILSPKTTSLGTNLSLFLQKKNPSIIYLLAFGLSAGFCERFSVHNRKRLHWTRTSVVIYVWRFCCCCCWNIRRHRVNTYLRTRNQLNSLMPLRSSKSNAVAKSNVHSFSFLCFFFFCSTIRRQFLHDRILHIKCVSSNASKSEIKENKHQIGWLELNTLVYVCLCVHSMFEQNVW